MTPPGGPARISGDASAGLLGTPAPLGLIAGSGEVPLRIAHAAAAGGRPVFAALLEGWAQPAEWRDIPHVVARIGAAGSILGAFRRQGVEQLVLSGGLQRPSLLSLRPDGVGARLLGRIGRAYFQGDDGLLRAVAVALEAEGFEILPAQAVLRDILPAAGLLGAAAPDERARADIARGVAVARALGAVDVGQAVVVQQGMVLGVEAIEGTDALLARCAALQREGAGGVLVKLVKPGQDRRLDLPTIGPRTIAGAKAAGLAGIAIEAGGTILVDRPATLAAADAAGLFLLAIDPDHFPEPTTEDHP